MGWNETLLRLPQVFQENSKKINGNLKWSVSHFLPFSLINAFLIEYEVRYSIKYFLMRQKTHISP